jgi:serine/threonine-protein kinase RsbW
MRAPFIRETVIDVPPRLDALSEFAADLHAQLQALLPAGLEEIEGHAIELALWEALTNIARHGYREAPEGAWLRITWRERPGAVEVDVQDAGSPIPANVLREKSSTPERDPDDLDALPESGMGLAIIHAAFDEVQYATAEGVNTLRLVKRLPTTP